LDVLENEISNHGLSS
jgi:hypothetical protein